MSDLYDKVLPTRSRQLTNQAIALQTPVGVGERNRDLSTIETVA